MVGLAVEWVGSTKAGTVFVAVAILPAQEATGLLGTIITVLGMIGTIITTKVTFVTVGSSSSAAIPITTHTTTTVIGCGGAPF